MKAGPCFLAHFLVYTIVCEFTLGLMRTTRIVFGLTAGVVAASTLITFSFGNRVIEHDSQEELRQKSISDLDAVMSTVLDAETGQRGFIITGDGTYSSLFQQAESRVHEKVGGSYKAKTRISQPF